jgi:hypothetical protein
LGQWSSTRRGLIGGAAATAMLGSAVRAAAFSAPKGNFTADQIRARDLANMAATRLRRAAATPYAPLTGGIVHFFGYGQSLSGGYYGVPVLSTTQPYDNLMIGQSTRATDNADKPASSTWVPVGNPGPNGIYPFEPMIATAETSSDFTSGETPGEGAINFFRHAYLQSLGLSANPNTRFVLTNCGIGGQTIAKLSKGANPEIYNRLLQAASYVKQTANSMGLSYQVGGMIWTQGEQDVQNNTSYQSYLASLQQLQADFLVDVVQGIAGQSAQTVVPWFCHQPDYDSSLRTTAVYQALLDWANTPGSNLYLAGPVYQYPDHKVHLTANGYRWHANQVGKAMTDVLLKGVNWNALYMISAEVTNKTVLVSLNVPVPPIVQGVVYNQYAVENYPFLGFIVTDSKGHVPLFSASIVGPTTVEILLKRSLESNPVVQSAYNTVNNMDWGTNICDSDKTLADDVYVYTPGVQDPGEDIPSWNGAPLIGQPYPLSNYLAVSQVPITTS